MIAFIYVHICLLQKKVNADTVSIINDFNKNCDRKYNLDDDDKCASNYFVKFINMINVLNIVLDRM